MSREKTKAEEVKSIQQVFIRLPPPVCEVLRDVVKYRCAVLFIGTTSSGPQKKLLVHTSEKLVGA